MKLHCTRALVVAQYETLGIIAPFIVHMIVTRSGIGNCQKKICVSNPFSIGLLSMVSAAAMSAFQLQHTSRLLRSICPGGLSNTDYRIWENVSHVGLWGILWARI